MQRETRQNIVNEKQLAVNNKIFFYGTFSEHNFEMYLHLRIFRIRETHVQGEILQEHIDKILHLRNTNEPNIEQPTIVVNKILFQKSLSSDIFIFTCSKSYWQDNVAAFPMITASGTKIFNSRKQNPANKKEITSI